MTHQITSKVIGQLTQDENFADWWISNPFEIPFFDNDEFTIIFMGCVPEQDKTFIEEADSALTNFFKLNASYKNSISELAYKNLTNFMDAVSFNDVDKPLREITNKNEIWKFIYPTKIYVARRPYNEKDMYVQIVCECEWEQEHGLQFVFRQGKKLTRISDQDGHLTESDAYGKPDEEDDLLSKF